MKYSDIVDRPAYKAPDKCPICEDWPFNGYTPDIKTTEDGETVFVWRCRRCSMCGREYEVPSKEISQRMYVMKRCFIEKFPESFAYGVVASLAGFGAVILTIIFIVYIFK